MDLKMHVYSVPLRSPFVFPASFGILRWGTPLTRNYTLTTDTVTKD